MAKENKKPAMKKPAPAKPNPEVSEEVKPLEHLPKPAFVGNIDTANEEIVRLVDQANGFIDNVNEANASLAEANELAANAVSADDLRAAQEAQREAEEALETATKEHKAAVVVLNDKVNKSKGQSVRAAAAAGVDEPVDTDVDTEVDDSDPNKTKGLTGLSRAIAANIALQKGKGAPQS